VRGSASTLIENGVEKKVVLDVITDDINCYRILGTLLMNSQHIEIGRVNESLIR
jgi:hypothetical protein